MRAQDNLEAIEALMSPKVTTDRDGRLMGLSARMLLVELERWGLRLVNSNSEEK